MSSRYVLAQNRRKQISPGVLLTHVLRMLVCYNEICAALFAICLKNNCRLVICVFWITCHSDGATSQNALWRHQVLPCRVATPRDSGLITCDWRSISSFRQWRRPLHVSRPRGRRVPPPAGCSRRGPRHPSFDRARDRSVLSPALASRAFAEATACHAVATGPEGSPTASAGPDFSYTGHSHETGAFHVTPCKLALTPETRRACHVPCDA